MKVKEIIGDNLSLARKIRAILKHKAKKSNPTNDDTAIGWNSTTNGHVGSFLNR